MWELEKSLNQKLNDLIKIGLSIQNIYFNLYRLEKENKKDSLEFRKYVNYLQLAIEIENQKFKPITRREDEMNLILYYLEEKYNLYNVDVYYDYMYLGDESRVVTRIMETVETALDDICIDDEYEVNEDYFVAVSDLKVYSMINKTIAYLNLKNKSKQLKINKNLENLKIQRGEQKNMRELYLEYKYNMAFVDKDIEKSFIINNFNALELPIFTIKEQADILNISIDDYRKEIGNWVSYDIVKHIFTYGDFTDIELLLKAHAERKMLSLWHLINTFSGMNNHQLLKFKEMLNKLPNFSEINDKDKQTILTIINDSISNSNDNFQKTYKKKK